MLKEQVIRDVEVQDLIHPGDRILVAFSGGSDSLALLSVLHELSPLLGFTLGAAHVNHGLRGASADEDEAFCRTFAQERGIPFHSKKMDIEALAEAKGWSLEMAGREARYAFFKEIMVQENYTACATAHHQDDQRETILLHLFRGTGLTGLSGMAFQREAFIRPLLSVEKEEILTYLEEKGLSPREDETNKDPAFLRNRIRLEVIPYIQQHFNGDFPQTLSRMAKTLREDREFIEEEVQKVRPGVLREEQDRQGQPKVVLTKEAFTLPMALRIRMIREAVALVKGNLQNIEEVHLRDIEALSRKESGKMLDVKDEIVARHVYGEVIITRKSAAEPSDLRTTLPLPGSVMVEGRRVEARVVSREALGRDPRCRYFDRGAFGEEILIRHREVGDKMKPLGMTGNRKVKSILIDKKMNREDRDRLLVLVTKQDIFSLGNQVISEDYKVKESTQEVLEIGIYEEENK